MITVVYVNCMWYVIFNVSLNNFGFARHRIRYHDDKWTNLFNFHILIFQYLCKHCYGSFWNCWWNFHKWNKVLKKTCLLTSSKELINTTNNSDFAAFEDLSTRRGLSADIWILFSGCCKRNELKVYEICKRCFVRF